MKKRRHNTGFGYGEMELLEIIVRSNELRAWTAEVHESCEQRKRQRRVWAAWTDDVKLARDGSSAIIRGFKTTLDSCTCPDFRRRQLPCIHVYALPIHKMVAKAKSSKAGAN